MKNKYVKRITLFLIISIVSVNTSYSFTRLSSTVINASVPQVPWVHAIKNSSERYKMANLIDEDYPDIKKAILLGNYKSEAFKGFVPISKSELIYILDRYATLKNLEMKGLDNNYSKLEPLFFDAEQPLITAEILKRNFMEQPLTFAAIKEAIDKIKEMSEKKKLIEKDINLILKNTNKKLDAKEQLNFNLIHGQTGASISYNGESTNHPASIIKTFYLYVFLKEVEAGKRSLEDKRLFMNKDKYNGRGTKITGSGILQDQKTNIAYTWGELLRLMIIESDNVATSMVMRELGIENIDQWAKKVDLTNTTITGPIYTAAGVPTKSSAIDLTKVLYLLDTLANEMRNFALKQIHDCKAKDRIAKKTNSVKWLGNKSGTLTNYVGDSAIIRYGDNNTIYMTIILRTTDDSRINIIKSEKIISETSHEIVELLQSSDKNHKYIKR